MESSMNTPPLENMKKEFDLISVFPNATMRGEREIVSKYGVQSVSAEYIASRDLAEILDYYRNELSKKGWTYRRTIKDDKMPGAIYCKENLHSIIQKTKSYAIPGTPANTIYSFAIRWNTGH